MASFYFEQYCSRDKRGHRWKDLQTVPANWKNEFFNRLAASGTFPKDGRILSSDSPTGGAYISWQSDFGVVYRFICGNNDFAGRPGTVITNCLFFKLSDFHGQSLKKAFNHPSLLSDESTDIQAENLIDLDKDFTGPQAFSAILHNSAKSAIFTIPDEKIIIPKTLDPCEESKSADMNSSNDLRKEIFMQNPCFFSKLKLFFVYFLFGCIIGSIVTILWIKHHGANLSADGNYPIRIEGIDLNHKTTVNKKILLNFHFEPVTGSGRNIFNLSISQIPVKNEE